MLCKKAKMDQNCFLGEQFCSFGFYSSDSLGFLNRDIVPYKRKIQADAVSIGIHNDFS